MGIYAKIWLAAAVALWLVLGGCGNTYTPAPDNGDNVESPAPPDGPDSVEPPAPVIPAQNELGPRTEAADAAAQRLVNLLLSDVEFDFGQLNAGAAAGIPLSFSCIVDTSESPTIEEIEASIKMGCGEWGNPGNKGIAFGGGIAVFVVTPWTGAAPQGDVTEWARAQTNLMSPQNTYAPGSAEYQTLTRIIGERCSGTSIEEKVKSVNRLLVGWYWYNSGGQRDAFTCLNGAYLNGAWGTQCDGYSRSMTALLRAWGVKTRYIKGMSIRYDTRSSASHAWVQVWDGSEWRMADPTWNDPAISEDEAWWYPDGYIESYYLNRWMLIRTINGDRVITDQGGSYGPPSDKFHNARF